MPSQSLRAATLKRYRAGGTVIASAMIVFAAAASADDAGPSMFSINGFGTLGVVHSSEDQADFTTSILKPNGAGYTRSWSADVDSRVAIQVTVNATPRLSAVVQLVAEQGHDNTYTPTVEWANIKYAFTPDFSIRVGRVALPNFLVSDYRRVGYANPWVRPPIEVYNLIPATRNDGVDISYRLHFGEVTTTMQAIWGSIERTIPDGTGIRAKDQWGVFNTTEYGALTLHFAWYQSRFTVETLRPLFESFRQFGSQGIAIADRYNCDARRITLHSLGASYDPGKWFVTGEWARRNSDCFVGSNTAWYVNGGYRIDRFTPYLSYAQVRADSDTSAPGLTVSALPPFLRGLASSLNAGLNMSLALTPIHKTVSVGARWDFRDNFDLKLQFDHIRLGTGSRGPLINTQPGFQTGGTVNVFSAVVDFVF